MIKKREFVFFSIFFLFLFFIIFNFGIHIVRTIRFNQKIKGFSANEKRENCYFDIHFRGGAADSWLKRDVLVEDKVCTLKGITFDGSFCNESEYEVSDWNLRINIDQDCFINNCWCGTVEIHQSGKIQTLDLRNLNKRNVKITGYDVGQDYLIPLHKGDSIVYHPSIINDEVPVRAYNGLPGTVTIGFIFYTDASQNFDISNYYVRYKFRKSCFQGTEPKIFEILFSLWFVVLILKIAVRIAYRRARLEALRKLNAQRMEDMKAYNAKLNAEVEAKTAHIKEIQRKVVIGLANVIGNRDPDTGGHVKRTSDVIRIVVDEFRKQHKDLIDDQKAKYICRAAPMHDLGKIYIESSILCKKGKLTEEEFKKMKKHAENSGDIVKLILNGIEDAQFVQIAINVARNHHERWDGTGYPDQLAGENIPLEARLMTIADVYDALVSRRCYKQPYSFEKAFEIMMEGMGTQFDPQMKEVVIACRPQLENYYTSC